MYIYTMYIHTCMHNIYYVHTYMYNIIYTAADMYIPPPPVSMRRDFLVPGLVTNSTPGRVNIDTAVLNGWMNWIDWMDGLDGWMDGWMDGWIDG